MTAAARTDAVEVADGRFDLHVWLPPAGHGPGMLLLQEIFGVGPYIRAVATRLADLGYVVGAPDVFWRLRPGWAADHDEAGLAGSMELAGRLDVGAAVADCVAALARLEELPEVDGRPGALGFCLGGTLAWFVGVEGSPAAVVSYYGSGVPDGLDAIDAIACPTLLHFGGDDAFIPAERVERVASVVGAQPGFELHVHDGAGHAFDNHEAPMFHQPDAAARAWAVTTAFLARHLPV